MTRAKAIALILATAIAPAPGFAELEATQTTDAGKSGAFEVVATFKVVERGDTAAAATAGDGDLYLGDRAMLRVTYDGAKLLGDQADVTCLMLDHQPDGVTSERDCSPERVPFGTVGTRGEYAIGFTVLPTDAPGLWKVEVRFADARTADLVTVEIRFNVHTGMES